MTNADKIRQMTDEELAMFMVIQAIMGAVSASGITDRNVAKEMVKVIMDSEDAKNDIEAAKEHLKQEADK